MGSSSAPASVSCNSNNHQSHFDSTLVMKQPPPRYYAQYRHRALSRSPQRSVFHLQRQQPSLHQQIQTEVLLFRSRHLSASCHTSTLPRSSPQPFPVSSTGVATASTTLTAAGGAAASGPTAAATSVSTSTTTVICTKSTSVVPARPSASEASAAHTSSDSATNSFQEIDVTRPKSDLYVNVDSSSKCLGEVNIYANENANDKTSSNAKWNSSCDTDANENEDKPSAKFTKQEAVDCRDDLKLNGFSVDGSSRVWENFQYPAAESRKIQRTATVIEQEAIQTETNVETSFSVVEPKRYESTTMTGVQTSAACSATSASTDRSEPLVPLEVQSSTSAVEAPAAGAAPAGAAPAGGAGAGAAGDATSSDGERPTPHAAESLSNGGPLAASECGSDIEDGGIRRGHERCLTDAATSKGTSTRTWTGVSPSNPFFAGAQQGGVCSGVYGAGGFVRRPLISHEALSMLKYPFFTMTNFPSGFVLRIGGTVSARCVKLLERSHAAPVEVESRDSWWAQLRGEVRMHCSALGCNVILGYTEFTSICDDVCILNVSGTAAIVSVSSDSVLGSSVEDYGPSGYVYNPAHPHHSVPLPVHHYPGPIHHSASFDKKEQDTSAQPQKEVVLFHCRVSKVYASPTSPTLQSGGGSARPRVSSPRPIRRPRGGSLRGRQTSVSEDGDMALGGSASTPHKTSVAVAAASGILYEPVCCVCHSPFADAVELPFKVAISKCALCKHGKVTDILLATIEPPPGIPITGRGCLVQARVFKPRREVKGEAFAKEVSDALPFVEYEITKIIINKVRIAGMNAIFGLRVRLSVGERLVVAVASGTAVYLSALPPPVPPQVVVDSSEGEEVRRQWQHKLAAVMRTNREFYGVQPEKRTQRTRPSSRNASELSTQSSDSEGEDLTAGDLSAADIDFGAPATSYAGGALEIDFSAGNKEACLLELDDSEDAEMADHLVNSSRPSLYRPLLATTHTIPGLPLSGDCCGSSIQMFTKVYRESFSPASPLNQRSFNAYFDNVIESVCFRVRKLQPCVITGLRFDVDIPEQDELQINVLGAIVRLPLATLPLAVTAPLTDGKAALDITGSDSKPVQPPLAAGSGRNQFEDNVTPLVAGAAVVPVNQVSEHKSHVEPNANEIYDGILQQLQLDELSKSSGNRNHYDGELTFKMEEVSDAAGKKSTAFCSAAAEGGGAVTVGRPSRKLAYASSSSSSCGSCTARPLLQHQPRVHNTPSLSSCASVQSTTSPGSGGVSSVPYCLCLCRINTAPQDASAASDSWYGVYISPLPFVPGARIERHLGNLNFCFIRESNCVKEVCWAFY
ncbi:hypothetical protein FHG87_001188 [Trinorchestia longiramus]|nr:hypothetical protein FHG87_001188 [Trinorchestia longiramus]